MTQTYCAPAKVNLMLHITGKRADGYHLLNTLISFIDLADFVQIEETDSYALSVDGPFASHAPAGEDNLVTKAVRAMEQASGKRAGVSVTLTKNIPAGAGLGGGSADAAATMHALNERWGNPFTLYQLQEIGLKLGAELPVCLAGGAHFVSGIGEIVRPAQIPSFDAVVVWPGKKLATKDVFAVYQGGYAKPVAMPDKISGSWISMQRNDLTDAAIQLQPVIRAVIAETGGRMSGSGSAVFAITADPKKMAADLAATHPDWWVKTCKINASAA